jgi:ribonuclease D
MLRVLLKANSEKIGVAQKIIATTSELDQIASGESVEKIFHGWRYKVFGQDVLRLCEGKIGLTVNNNKIITFDID